MPGNHGEISIDEHNGVDNDNKKKKTMTTRKKKKKKDVIITDDFENGNDQLVMPSISKTKKKRFIAKIISNKPKSPVRCSSHHSSPRPPSSRSGSRKGGCFRVIKPRRNEEEDSPSSPTSDPNDECFTHEMLRVMIETNDFSSNDCNPHR